MRRLGRLRGGRRVPPSSTCNGAGRLVVDPPAHRARFAVSDGFRRVNTRRPGMATARKLTGMVSSGNSATRRYTRLMVYDASTNPDKPTLLGRHVVPLPVFRAGDKTLVAAQSELLALNDHQFFVLSRDSGNGQGAEGRGLALSRCRFGGHYRGDRSGGYALRRDHAGRAERRARPEGDAGFPPAVLESQRQRPTRPVWTAQRRRAGFQPAVGEAGGADYDAGVDVDTMSQVHRLTLPDHVVPAEKWRSPRKPAAAGFPIRSANSAPLWGGSAVVYRPPFRSEQRQAGVHVEAESVNRRRKTSHLWAIVDASLAQVAVKRRGTGMSVEHHLPRLWRIDHHERHPAVAETDRAPPALSS